MKRFSFYWLCLAVVMLLWAVYPASAEIYRYKDDCGNTYYTNDPVAIPRQYQKSIQVQGETVTYPEDSTEAPAPERTGAQEEAGAGDQEAGDSGGQEPAEGQAQQPRGDLTEVDALKTRETDFNNEFKALQEERTRLDEAMKKSETKEDREKVNAATVEFNLKFKDFHQRRQAFKEEVTKYNDQVRQDMEQKLEQYKTEQAARSQGGTVSESSKPE